MDSLTVTTITHTTVTQEVWQKFTPLLWVVLFLGLTSYWLGELNKVSKKHLESNILQILACFARENWIEVPLSVIGCIMFAIMNDLPLSAQDSIVVIIMVFTTGFGGSSIINKIITSSKAKEGITSLLNKNP